MFSSLTQAGALRTQGLVPQGVTRLLLGMAGVTLGPVEGGRTYPSGRRAAACVSLDFDVTKESRADANHAGTHLLLYCAERYGVPLTWAICGMTVEKDPEPFEAVMNSGGTYEIASHTYSHLRVDAATPAELEADMERWRAAVGSLNPRTIIFPFNKSGNFETLKKMGFSNYRGEERRVGAPVAENGLCNISPVVYLSGRSDGTLATAKMFIDLCIRYQSVFHLWSHPWNMAREGDPTRYSQLVLGPIFAYLKEKQDEGSLRLCTMNELAGSMQLPAAAPSN